MDLLTSVAFDGVENFPALSRRANLCTISRKNLIAFSAPRCYKLKKSPAETSRFGDGIQSGSIKLTDCDFGGVADTVFVCPLSTPWNVHAIVPMDYEIKHIVWDPYGTKLLTADASGQIFLWQMHESLINKWTYTNFTRSLYGDDVIGLKWITSSQLFTIGKDVREEVAYEKRFPLACANPAVGFFGGRSIDVWVAVTSSGVVGVGLVQQKTEMVVTRVALESFEDRRLTCADIVVEANGSVKIVTTTGGTKDPIRLHKLTIDLASNGCYMLPNNCTVTCDCFSCFFVDKCTEDDSISSVQYVQPLSGQIVLVGIDKTHGTEIQQWAMCEETLGLHTAFHANTIIPEKNFHWIRQTFAQFTSYVTAYAANPLITDKTSLFPLGSAFACDDQTLRITSRLSLSDMQSCSTELSNTDEKIVSLCRSPNGCVCVAMTTRCRMLIFAAPLSVEHITTLLEYDMITGITWEDVLLCIRSDSNLIDKISQSMDASFCKQSSGTQIQYKPRLEILKVALSMSSEAGLVSSADHLTALLLHHIRNCFVSVLSTSEYDDECDQNAEEKFRELLLIPANISETDIDKLVTMLEPCSDFQPDESAVAGLQPLVQWLCDLSMTLLSSLPAYSFSTGSGCWLAKDLKSLTTLREQLILIRMWYNTVPKIRPVLSCSMSFDALAKLFKLLTLLISSVKDGGLPPNTLLDECSQLPNQLVIPPFEKSICWSQLPSSINLERCTKEHVFGDSPSAIGCLRVPFGQYTANGRKDVYTQIAVNNHISGDEYKKCIRCHAMTVLTRQTSDQKSRLTINTHYCICGGVWYLST